MDKELDLFYRFCLHSGNYAAAQSVERWLLIDEETKQRIVEALEKQK